MKVACTLPLFLTVALSTAGAQTFTGTILGTVKDSSGAVMPAVKLRAIETSTNVERVTVSNELGYYEYPLLRPGTYRIEAEYAGFKKFTRGGLKLDIGQRMEIPIVLTAGDVAEVVEVRGEAPFCRPRSLRSGS